MQKSQSLNNITQSKRVKFCAEIESKFFLMFKNLLLWNKLLNKIRAFFRFSSYEIRLVPSRVIEF